MYLQNLSASLASFFKKAIDEETLKKKKEFKETRKKGRERERGRGREKEMGR